MEDHLCPCCDHDRVNTGLHGLLGWIVAVAFFALWVLDSALGGLLAAILIEWVW
jgi:hypothetical protein